MVDFQGKPAPSIRIHPVFLAFSPPAAPALLHSDLNGGSSNISVHGGEDSRRALAPTLDGAEVEEELQLPYAVAHFLEERSRGRTCSSCSAWSMSMRFKMAEAFFNLQFTDFLPASDGQ